MSAAGALLLILTGLAIMGFGLFLFYAWLPLLYGLVGLDIGLLLGRSLTGEVGFTAIVFGLIGAIALALASYFLEPYRRVLIGVFGGFLLGVSLAALLGLEGGVGGIVGTLLGVIFGFIGGFVVPRYFDSFLIVASAISGAAMVMTGAHILMPGVSLFDRASGGFLPAFLSLVLAVAGMGWQFKNVVRWVQSEGIPGTRSGDQARRPLP